MNEIDWDEVEKALAATPTLGMTPKAVTGQGGNIPAPWPRIKAFPGLILRPTVAEEPVPIIVEGETPPTDDGQK